MSTKQLLESYIQEHTKAAPSYPEIVSMGILAIEGDIPFRLKLSIALSELITFSAHLRRPIKLYDGTLVPTNAITFALSASGTSKDKSLNALRKSLGKAYEKLEEGRKEFARSKAKDKARAEGKPEDWLNFYKAPKPLQCGLGTTEGLVQHFAEIAESPLGSGSILSSEIGSELQSNSSIVDIIKTVSVAYDLGNVPIKVIKSAENQTANLKGFPVNALLFGSQDGILFDNAIKSKFKLVFNTQLARRSIFSFTPVLPAKQVFATVDDLYNKRETARRNAAAAQQHLNEYSENLVDNIKTSELVLDDEAQKLFDVYLEYNSILSEEMSNKYPISKLSRQHKQWLALKIAGSYANLEGADSISVNCYATAINTVELLANDLVAFEKELIKETYEQLVDLCKFRQQTGEFFLSLHELRKLSYVSGTGSSKSKVEELCMLANSCDDSGSYTARDNGIAYQSIVKTNVIGVSYILFDTNKTGKDLKDYMSRNCSKGYDFTETDFSEIGNLLTENAAYTPFQFTNGERNKANLFGSTKFVVMDVDKSVITDVEAHTLLEEYNHYIARTSDENNEFKFRVLIELDSAIDVDEQLWKPFIQEIANELGLIVDELPKSQIALSYANRKVLKQLRGKPLEAKVFLDRVIANAKEPTKSVTTLPPKEKQQLLDSPRQTFSYAFEAEQGERSKKIYRALAHAIDLGANAEYIENLAHEINNYLPNNMDKDRLERTLIIPALRRIGI